MTVEPFADLLGASPSGNGRLAVPFDGNSLDVEIEPDPLTGAYQWFHFRVRADGAVPIRIVNTGASSYPRGWEDCIVWVQPAGGRWRPLRAAHADGIVTFSHAVPGSVVSYALFPPYRQARLARLAQRVAASPAGQVVPGDTKAGRAARFALGGDASARQIWIVCGQHGSEHPALWFADGLVEALLQDETLLAGKRFHVVPIANPGGMRRGFLRTNPLGQDPNRHWGEGRAACPEVATLLDAMEGRGVDVLLDVHTDFEMGTVYLDVLDEWMETPERLSRLREDFEHGLAEFSSDVAFGRRYPWSEPPSPDLLAGMCAPAVERRFGAAAITLELPIGRYRDALGAPGIWYPRHSLALGRAAAAVLLGRA
ncbi:M14-type cytosolic carboxypeptidase [Kumtagia ephedrae]|uniref:Peptidase M14 domain-containing protein n=1 Tax=Kumtagia ephedrae TaxID=2116701 RepID=A0A2P7SS46_9HYPH|nr:M14-type cytosolic carboxypeptidase [Mesorhizobium ephedrae]PSJ65155.1 hypothetical protein C7I84_02065 [Mesorhizobium ephedrae]